MNKLISNKIYITTFVLAILIIAIHSSCVGYLNSETSGYTFSYVIQRMIITIADAAVPLFFVISGYLLFRNFTLKSYPRMLLKKVFSLVIPYFIWSVTGFIIIRLIYPLIVNGAIELTFKDAVLDILLANCCPQIWFVRPLLVYFICSPILYFAFKYLRKWSIAIPVILFIIYFFFKPYYSGILFWIPFFFIGSFLSYFNVMIQNHYRPQIIGAISLIILVSVGTLFGIFDIDMAESHIYFVYRYIGPVLLWMAMDVAYNLFLKEEVGQVFKISAFLFFSHTFITFSLHALLDVLIHVDVNMIYLLEFFIIWSISSGVLILLGYVLKRFMNPVYKVITGRS